MTVEATVIAPTGELHLVASEALEAGSIHLFSSSGAAFPYVVAGCDDIASGDKYTGLWGITVKVAAASALTGSVGDAVQWDNTNKEAVASGDFVLGQLTVAKSAGQTYATVMLKPRLA